MSVVKNLMIRIGADYSGARKGMQAATGDLNKFKRDTTRTTAAISGKKGFGGVSTDFKNLGSTVTSSLSQIRGAKGIGGVTASLGSLRPALGAVTGGLRGMSGAAAGAGAVVGGTALAITGLVAAMGLAVAGVYAASQTAVKFESDLGRLNMQLKGSSREFMEWSRAQGLAKSSSAQLGATYSVLLSSFGMGNQKLLDETKKITQATRVVASATGRTIEDTLERMRSGLLGNTEAIEDLGIFVGVSMIESTNAFKKFANGKSWDQLDFRVQQQIRLQAILEQAYARYGNELQNNVMTKQSALMEQLKDIKLNLSQAFLPIWDAVLPALTQLATALATGTESLARFAYWLRGWNYDEATKGTDKQTDAVTDQGKAYDDLGKSAKKAKGALAAFDEINQLGDSSGGGEGGTGGGAGGMPTLPVPGKNEDPTTWVDDLLKKLDLIPEVIKMPTINPPSPPDGGAGAVATAWVTTQNALIATMDVIKAKWDELKLKMAELPPVTVTVSTTFTSMLTQMQSGINAYGPQIITGFGTIINAMNGLTVNAPVVSTSFATMLDSMQSNLNTYGAPIATGLGLITSAMNGITLNAPITSAAFTMMLDSMQSNLNAYSPYLTFGLDLVTSSMVDLKLNAPITSTAFATMLAQMQTNLNVYSPTLVTGLGLVEASMKQLQIESPITSTAFATMLNTMQTDINAFQPFISFGLSLITLDMTNLIPVAAETSLSFQSMLENMQANVNAYQPYISYGIAGIGVSLSALIAGANASVPSWSAAWQAIYSVSASFAQPIISLFDGISRAYDRLMDMLDTPIKMPKIELPNFEMPKIATDISGALAGLDYGKILGDAAKSLGEFGVEAGLTVSGAKGLQVAGQASSKLGPILQRLLENLKNAGISVPALASGGITNGPMLAMIGDNPGGQEVVSPLDDLVGIVTSAVVTAVGQLSQFQNGNGEDVVLNIDGTALARVLNPYLANEQQRIGSSAIKQI